MKNKARRHCKLAMVMSKKSPKVIKQKSIEFKRRQEGHGAFVAGAALLRCAPLHRNSFQRRVNKGDPVKPGGISPGVSGQGPEQMGRVTSHAVMTSFFKWSEGPWYLW